jgi:hypothetical protein
VVALGFDPASNNSSQHAMFPLMAACMSGLTSSVPLLCSAAVVPCRDNKEAIFLRPCTSSLEVEACVNRDKIMESLVLSRGEDGGEVVGERLCGEVEKVVIIYGEGDLGD